MSKGWTLVQQEAQAQESRKETSASFGSELTSKQIKQAPGALVTVRFCEQGNEGEHAINVFPRHEYNVPDSRATKTGHFVKRFTCFKEIDPNCDCVGCRAGLKIAYRTVFNLIQRNRPVLRKDKDGKAIRNPDGSYIVEGTMDDIVFWECANTTADYLRGFDNKYGGLMSRDFELAWTGASFQPYSLMPADVDGGPQPMSDEDRALLAKRHDLDKIFAPPTVQEASSYVAKYGANSGANSTSQGIPNATQAAQQNPMLAGATLPPGTSPFAAAQQSNQ